MQVNPGGGQNDVEDKKGADALLDHDRWRLSIMSLLTCS